MRSGENAGGWAERRSSRDFPDRARTPFPPICHWLEGPHGFVRAGAAEGGEPGTGLAEDLVAGPGGMGTTEARGRSRA